MGSGRDEEIKRVSTPKTGKTTHEQRRREAVLKTYQLREAGLILLGKTNLSVIQTNPELAKVLTLELRSLAPASTHRH